MQCAYLGSKFLHNNQGGSAFISIDTNFTSPKYETLQFRLWIYRLAGSLRRATMDRIIYVIRVYGQGKTMVKSFGAEIPSHLNRPGVFDQASNSELKAMFRTLFLEHWDSLLAEQGPIRHEGCQA